jgi:hypothetical protein
MSPTRDCDPGGAPVRAVAAIGLVASLEALQPAVDRGRHLDLDDLSQSLAPERPIGLAQSSPCACMAFTTSKAAGKLSIVAARCDMGADS